MIGIAVQPADEEVAREFFELCKTPWESCRDGGRYEVIISTSPLTYAAQANLLLLYSADSGGPGAEGEVALKSRREGATISHAGKFLPIYGAIATFPTSTIDLVKDDCSGESLIFARRDTERTFIQVGYDLFSEIRFLLVEGQPPKNASLPTLELHVALLRDLITRCGLPFVEIPPVPEAHAFTVCLTHDIDHPKLRNHLFDHTMFGFFYRASVGSLINTFQGKLPLDRLWENWWAAIRLPFVFFGAAKDIWLQFDHYLQIEAGLGSTYFVIPKKGYPGRKKDGTSAGKRACRYTVAELVPDLRKVMAKGNEVGLHGLDAWLDVTAGRDEKETVSQALGLSEIGVRMHWLYFDRDTPAVLDQGGFAYDSTFGYNQTVGYRAGTAQVFRPLGTKNLLELPLLAMDTALFYPDYLNLGEEAAYQRVLDLVETIVQTGGVLTVNWHDRSIAPERLWKTFYSRILKKMKERGAWFPTAAQAVAWFRKRRHATIESDWREPCTLFVRAFHKNTDALPGMRLRIHQACQRNSTECLATGAVAIFSDVKLDNLTEFKIKI